MPEPISLETAKAHLRVTDTSEDSLITALITAAREWVENRTGKALVRREFVDAFDRWTRYLELRWAPVAEVTEVGYTDTDGEAATYEGFIASTHRDPARVYPAPDGWWPSLGRNGSVTVTYTAGFAAGEEPQGLLQAMLLLIGHWYSVREGVNVGNIINEVPFAVEALCDQHRVPGL
ncbi:MAG TPA: head-tail connector protein [Sphingomicrobium sp.]|nr:head-tail connector protein [Sphingomicrobium sp.]